MAACPKHSMACPRTCWKVGQTVLSIFNGRLVHARTFTTVEAAEHHIAGEIAGRATNAVKYVEAGLPLPAHYADGYAQFVMWDGGEAPPSAYDKAGKLIR